MQAKRYWRLRINELVQSKVLNKVHGDLCWKLPNDKTQGATIRAFALGDDRHVTKFLFYLRANSLHCSQPPNKPFCRLVVPTNLNSEYAILQTCGRNVSEIYCNGYNFSLTLNPRTRSHTNCGSSRKYSRQNKQILVLTFRTAFHKNCYFCKHLGNHQSFY